MSDLNRLNFSVKSLFFNANSGRNPGKNRSPGNLFFFSIWLISNKKTKLLFTFGFLFFETVPVHFEKWTASNDVFIIVLWKKCSLFPISKSSDVTIIVFCYLLLFIWIRMNNVSFLTLIFSFIFLIKFHFDCKYIKKIIERIFGFCFFSFFFFN